MGCYLMLDIGAGTMDVLYYDTESNLNYKAVVCSPTKQLAYKISMIKENLLITGFEMGGGPVSKAIKAKAKNGLVLMSEKSAATIHHNPDKVEKFGINIIGRKKKAAYSKITKFHEIQLADIQIERIKQITDSFGVPFRFDAVAICAQDHGVPPDLMTHLDFRHNHFSKHLSLNSKLSSFLYDVSSIPDSMNRLYSIAQCALKLPTQEVYVMDSGIAAILGASMDLNASLKNKIIVLDIATSHTVAASIKNGIISNFFEYHTKDITSDKLELLIKALPEGKISHSKILKEGGHGAYTSGFFKYSNVQKIIVTGPKRHIIKNCNLPITFGSPWGDNMMTGTTGLMEALRLNKGIEPIDYI